MESFSCIYLLFILNLFVTFLSSAEERFGLFRSSGSFDGLSLEFIEVSKVQCSARCLSSTCRGIQFDGGHCRILFETGDVPEDERSKYNQTSLVSNGEINILRNALHRCSSNDSCLHGGVCEAFDGIYQCNCTGTNHHGTNCETAQNKCLSNNPCRHGGVCEELEDNYQCNCTGTDHHGPMCETAGNPWAAPDGWNGSYPQLNLNLDDQTPYVLHSGAMHVATDNGFGFKTDGNPQYVDLGNWTGETCFVDVDSCEKGFTMLAYVDISAPVTLGTCISAAVEGTGQQYGPFIHTFATQIGFTLGVKGTLFTAQSDVGLTYPTGWIRLMMVYTTGVGVQVHIDNTVGAQKNTPTPSSLTTLRSGHIMIGRRYVDTSTSTFYGKLTVDWLTIWDRPLTEEERNLLH